MLRIRMKHLPSKPEPSPCFAHGGSSFFLERAATASNAPAVALIIFWGQEFGFRFSNTKPLLSFGTYNLCLVFVSLVIVSSSCIVVQEESRSSAMHLSAYLHTCTSLIRAPEMVLVIIICCFGFVKGKNIFS